MNIPLIHTKTKTHIESERIETEIKPGRYEVDLRSERGLVTVKQGVPDHPFGTMLKIVTEHQEEASLSAVAFHFKQVGLAGKGQRKM